jgi:hypothetical protein
VKHKGGHGTAKGRIEPVPYCFNDPEERMERYKNQQTGGGMAETPIELAKQEVKKEFNRRKKTEAGLKLSHVFNDVARQRGFRNWNTWRAHLDKLPE